MLHKYVNRTRNKHKEAHNCYCNNIFQFLNDFQINYFISLSLSLSLFPVQRGYYLKKNITRHMRIQTRRQILFACEFATAKRRKQYENTYYTGAPVGKCTKKKGNKNERTNKRGKGSSRRTVFPVEIPITINYIVIKSRYSRTLSRLTELSVAVAAASSFHFVDDPKGDENTE